jgi:hypothetical protein
MKINLMKHLRLALTGMALAGYAGIASAQAPLIQWNYNTNAVPYQFWFGGTSVTTEWNANWDAASNPASGSLEFDVNWNGDQWCNWHGFSDIGGWDNSVSVNLDLYQTESFDIRVDPSSTGSAASDGNFGQLDAINNVGWSQDTIGTFTIPGDATNNWYHVSLTIPKGLGNSWGPGFVQAPWEAPSPASGNVVTFYIDNLTFTPAPPNVAIITQPLNEEVYAGRNIALTVGVSGGNPYGYQWYKGSTPLTDGGNITGSSLVTSNTTESLVISNVSAADISNYYVIITNSVNSITSSIVNLNILTTPNDAFAAQTLALGPVAYYEFNETNNPANSNAVAYDHVGGFAGLYQSTVSNLFDGYVGPQPADGFTNLLANTLTVSNNGAAFFPGNNGKISLPPLNLNSANVTFAAWINPAGAQPFASSIVMSRSGSTSGSGFVFFNGTDLGYNWNNDSATWNWDSGIAPPQNQWSFVVLVVTPVDATIYLFNPTTTAASPQTANFVHGHAPSAFDGVTLIGQDQASTGRTLNGSVDDVAIYNRSLSYGEVTELYASATGEAVPPIIGKQPQSTSRYTNSPTPVVFSTSVAGVPTPTLQWQEIGGSLGANAYGATTSTLIISNATAANAGQYQLVATGGGISVTSSVVSLTITTPVGAYVNAVLAKNPIAFYSLNDTNDPAAGGALAFDPWGGLDGAYGINVQNTAEGIIGPVPANGYTGFNVANAGANFPGASGTFADDVVTAPAFNINGNTATYTAWINPGNADGTTGKTVQTQYAGLIFTRSGNAGLAWTQQATDASGDATLGFDWGGNNWSWNSGLTVLANTWSFVTLVVTANNATISVYSTNGITRAVDTVANPSINISGPTWIGGDGNGSATSLRTYNGQVADVAIFNRALSNAELDSLADVGGVITLVHVNGSQLTWNHGALLQSTSLTGPWTPVSGASSPYNLTPTGPGKFYRVQN